MSSGWLLGREHGCFVISERGLASASIDADAATTMVVWGGSEAMSRHLDTHDASRDAVFAGESLAD